MGAADSTSTDSLHHVHSDSLPHPHELGQDDDKDKMKLVQRTFNHKQQVYLGLGMMAFIALIMTTAQSWNPKN